MLVVFGSINLDLTYEVASLPKPGETIIASDYRIGPGGKGANQALAAARYGAKTALVGHVGDDANGLRVLNNLKKHEVMTSGIAKHEELPTGMAMITVDKNGENQIVVAPGANNEANESQVPSEILRPGNVLLVQMELPLEQTAMVMKKARQHGAKIIFNLAPVQKIPAALLSLVDILVMNELEAIQCQRDFGMTTSGGYAEQAKRLAEKGKLTCIITCGAAGAVAASKDGKVIEVSAPEIGEIVDTTGAGDCFCGTLAASLHEKESLDDAVRASVAAGTLSCTKPGAQDSYPFKDEIQKWRGKIRA
jgi:ribokinase